MRRWHASDLPPFTEMNLDPRVMEFFPQTFRPERTAKGLQQFNEHLDQYGFTYYAADRLDTSDFIGFIGMKWQTYESFFTPCIDIGWRLKVDAWGNGFATEGAKACLNHAFGKLHLEEIVSVAPALNQRSIRVMQKIGMQYVRDFEHPNIPEKSPLRICHLYQLKRSSISR